MLYGPSAQLTKHPSGVLHIRTAGDHRNVQLNELMNFEIRIRELFDSIKRKQRIHMLDQNRRFQRWISRIVKTLVLAVFHKSFTSSASVWESRTDNQEKDEKQSQNDKTGLGMEKL
ncbi:hypothetical protein Tco_1538031 [Tanacetum coccineum]